MYVCIYIYRISVTTQCTCLTKINRLLFYRRTILYVQVIVRNAQSHCVAKYKMLKGVVNFIYNPNLPDMFRQVSATFRGLHVPYKLLQVNFIYIPMFRQVIAIFRGLHVPYKLLQVNFIYIPNLPRHVSASNCYL
jgi:hypothetical protein